MAQVLTFLIDGVEMPCPSKFDIGIQDVSDPDAGRDLSGVMWKGKVAQKITIDVAYPYPTPDVAARVLQAIEPEYMQVTFEHPRTQSPTTIECYCGDRSAPYKFWWIGNKRFETLSFRLIER